MNPNKATRRIEVFSGGFTEAAQIKSLLESAGIEVFLTNEMVGSMHPALSQFGGVTVGVLVSEDDLERALELIQG